METRVYMSILSCDGVGGGHNCPMTVNLTGVVNIKLGGNGVCFGVNWAK